MTRYVLRCLTRALWRLLFPLVLVAALAEFVLLVVDDSGGSRLVFTFENGRGLVVENRFDRTSYAAT